MEWVTPWLVVQSGDAAERKPKRSKCQIDERKKKSFFSLFFSAFSQNALLLLKFLSFFLGLRPQIPCQELPLKSKSSCGVVRAEDTFPNLDHLGGFGGALSHPPSGCRAPSAWGGSGRQVGLGRVAQECHLQDCRYLFFLKF